MIKIGTEGGRAFFFIGTKATFVEHIAEYERKIRGAIKENKENSYARVHSLENHLERVKEDVTELQRQIDFEGDIMTRYEKMQTKRKLNAAERRAKTLPGEIEKAREIADRSSEAIRIYEKIAPNLKDRIVIETLEANRIIEPKPTIIIYIKGCENGIWWDSSENGNKSFLVYGFNLSGIRTLIEEGEA